MTDVTKNRNKFIGGSDVAAILGLDRYRTPYEVWEEKKHGIKSFEGNNVTEWGKILEPVIIQYFEKQHGVKVSDNNVRYISNEKDFLGCHPDGICEIKNERWLIEVKTVSSNAYKHWQNELPLEYYCQVQHNMFVTGLKKCKFVYLVLDDRSYNEIDVNFDVEYYDLVKAHLIKWWDNYIVGDATPIKVVSDYEKENPETATVEADDDTYKTYVELGELKLKIKELDKQKDVLEEQLKLKIGSATELMYGLETLATWSPSTSVKVDTKKLKEELPETFLKYAKETTSRRFLIKI